MARLKFPQASPPGGYTYRQKETGCTITSDNLMGLVLKVRQHRAYKGLSPTDVPTVRIEIERQICTRLNHEHCIAEPGDDWTPVKDSAHIKLSDILAFSKTMLEWFAKGLPLIPMKEAQRRRQVCVDCPLNRQPSGCKCGALYRLIAATVPKERQFEDVHVCGVCQCALKAKVNLPMEVIQAGTKGRDLQFPVHCWQHKALPTGDYPSKGGGQ